MGRFRFITPLAIFSIGAVCLVTMQLTPQDAANPAARNSVDEVPATTTTTDVVIAAPVTESSGRRRLLDSSSHMSKIGSPFSEGGASLWKNDYNVVHVLNTRFMQHQAKLTNLGKARLDLFETFTAPSIKSQTNQQFLWLIWTDANLAESSPAIHQELLQAVAGMPNVVVLASEQVDGNLRSFYGHSWSSLSRAMLSGDPKLFADYHKAAHSHVLMETRLDADDAFSNTFVESAQAQVAAAMGRGQYTQRGHVQQFCPESHVEWRYYKSNDVNAQDGELIHFDDQHFCIYTGWTTAFHLEREDDGYFTAPKSRTLMGNNCEEEEEDDCRRERSLEELFNNHDFDEEASYEEFNSRHRHRRATVGCTALPILDLDTVPWATYLSDQYETSHGIKFTAIGSSCFTPDSSGNDQNSGGAVRVFDTYQPNTNPFPSSAYSCAGEEGDPDLGSPNQNCVAGDPGFPTSGPDPLGNPTWSTPGVGADGSPSNCEPQGHVLVIQESNKPCVDDCSSGGKIVVEFTHGNGAILNSIKSLDTDENPTPVVNVWNKTDDLVFTGSFTKAGHNALSTMAINAINVKKLEVVFSGSGTLGGLDYEWCPESPCRRQLKMVPQTLEQQEQQQPQLLKLSSSTLHPMVLLARTPTAAGMKNVLPNKKGGGVRSAPLSTFDGSADADMDQKQAWQYMQQHFGVNQHSVVDMRKRLEGNMKKILVDAFAGQCTPGHSCKDSTKKALGYLLDNVYQNEQ